MNINSNTEKFQNPNPIINQSKPILTKEFLKQRELQENNEDVEDPLDEYEIYDIIKSIKDPEHPLTLEQIGVVSLDQIKVDNINKIITVKFTPTIPNCTMGSLIGLSIKVKLLNTVNRKYKIDVLIEEGKHDTEKDINKQLSDKERVFATLENDALKTVMGNCIKNQDEFDEIYI